MASAHEHGWCQRPRTKLRSERFSCGGCGGWRRLQISIVSLPGVVTGVWVAARGRFMCGFGRCAARSSVRRCGGARERAPSAVLRGIYCLHGCTLFCVQLIYYNALALPCVRGPGVCSALNPAVRL